MEKNKLIKKYISVCKSLFPVMGRQERDYFRKLKNDIIESTYYIPLNSIDDLYSQFGTPEEILNNYYSMYDTRILVKRLRCITIVKHIVSFILLLISMGIIYYDCYLYHTYTTYVENEIATYEEIIK